MGESKLRKVNESNLNEKKEKDTPIKESVKKKALPEPDDAAALVSEDFDPFGRKNTKESSEESTGRSKRRNNLPPLPDSPKAEGTEDADAAGNRAKKVEFITDEAEEYETAETPDEEYEADEEYTADEEALEDTLLEDNEPFEDFEDEDESEEEYEESEDDYEGGEEEELFEDEECEDDEEYEDNDEEEEEEYEDDKRRSHGFSGIGFKKPASGVVGAPHVKTSDERPQIGNKNNVPLSHSSAAQKELQAKTKVESYDVNFDGYYDDRLPAILDEVTKASYVDIVVKGILAVACIIILIIYCIYYVNV